MNDIFIFTILPKYRIISTSYNILLFYYEQSVIPDLYNNNNNMIRLKVDNNIIKILNKTSTFSMKI